MHGRDLRVVRERAPGLAFGSELGRSRVRICNTPARVSMPNPPVADCRGSSALRALGGTIVFCRQQTSFQEVIARIRSSRRGSFSALPTSDEVALDHGSRGHCLLTLTPGRLCLVSLERRVERRHRFGMVVGRDELGPSQVGVAVPNSRPLQVTQQTGIGEVGSHDDVVRAEVVMHQHHSGIIDVVVNAPRIYGTWTSLSSRPQAVRTSAAPPAAIASCAGTPGYESCGAGARGGVKQHGYRQHACKRAERPFLALLPGRTIRSRIRLHRYTPVADRVVGVTVAHGLHGCCQMVPPPACDTGQGWFVSWRLWVGVLRGFRCFRHGSLRRLLEPLLVDAGCGYNPSTTSSCSIKDSSL